MNVRIRRAHHADAEACGRVIYNAFTDVALRHSFAPDFRSVQAASRVAGYFIDHPAIFGVVAERDGQVVGTSFLDERDAIRGVGGVAVDPPLQGQGIGRRLMNAVLRRGRDAVGIRLVQDAFNVASMSLYASLGFEVKEPLVSIRGNPMGEPPAGIEVRPMRGTDVEDCGLLCRQIHGFDRNHELRDALSAPPVCSALVVVRHERIVAYTYSVFRTIAHGVAERATDMQALLSEVGAMSAEPLTLYLPTRQASLLRWCLSEGMRIVKPATLMALGVYREPRGCFVPSGLY